MGSKILIKTYTTNVNYYYFMLDFDRLYLKPGDIDTVIYHGPVCTDGFASAFVAWLYNKKELTYIPIGAGANELPRLSNKNILFVDVCPSVKLLNKVLSDNNRLIILDHHKTAIPASKELDKKHHIIVEKNESGASLAWKYFFRGKPLPLFIELVKARDIWADAKYKDELYAWLLVKEKSFELYKTLLSDQRVLEIVKGEGKMLLEHDRMYIDKAVSRAGTKFMLFPWREYAIVGLSNSTEWKSDIGNKLLSAYPFIDFSIVYSIDNNNNDTYMSARSDDTRYDVSIICSLLRGGGHRNASGASLGMIGSNFPGREICSGWLADEMIGSGISTEPSVADGLQCISILSQAHTKHFTKYLGGSYNIVVDGKERQIYVYYKYMYPDDYDEKYFNPPLIEYIIGTNTMYGTRYINILQHVSAERREELVDQLKEGDQKVSFI